MSDFFRFPHTPHIAWLGQGQPRDDKVLLPEEAKAFLQADIIIEEKIDGANLGFSVSSQGELRAQNRGHYLGRPFSGQFSRLEAYFAQYEDGLIGALSGGLMLFGEWCAARHSLGYERLPDYFIAFDVYDTNSLSFYSAKRRDAFASKLGIAHVSHIGQGRFSLAQLVDSIAKAQSSFRDGDLEGFYLRRDGDQYLESRAKLVKPGFTQAIGEHWSKRGIEWNGVAYGSL
jgi:ATP-dependent RNA circularization protein (DNA/RNA ligase family)